MIGGAKGIGIGIDFGLPNLYRKPSGKSYIEPDVLASLRVVTMAYGKKNDDSDRAIIKNLVDKDNPFIISNAAYKLNSGFGKYSADFESFDWTIGISQKQHNKATISLSGRLCNHAAIEVDEMKVNIIGNVTELIYWYIANPDDTARSEIRLTSGINTLPKSYAKDDGQTYNIGFAYISGDSEITIEQIPSFEGAFVTDGIDDLITSTKTVQEMLGGSNEITVVSMIHQVKDSSNNAPFTNYIRGSANGYFRNIVNNYDKTGIYGYTSSDLMGLSVVNNILGDKNDYTSNGDNRDSIINGNFSVQGYSYNDGNNTGDFSSVAWYWTVIANKVLTTDQINQVIAYYNLDRCVEPTVWYDVQKQGLTNETPDSDWYLKDYSGNGYDMTLYNYAKTPESGINADGGLQSDGVEDYGKVTGMPIYKDYTFIIDRQIISIGDTAGIVASKSEDLTDVNKQGAFLFEYLSAPNNISAWSFYKNNANVANTDFTRGISYQSKYSYNGIELLAGTAFDSDKLWLGTLRDKDSRFANVAIYSLMSFPYSMSEFLIERQLKKHKLGTLYPDMVEFRPIVKSNVKWNIIEIWQGDKSLYRPTVNDDKTGIYLKKDSTIGIYVKPKDADEVTKIVVNGTEYTNLKINSNGFYYVTLPITKSPQKINITIDEYIRFEDIVQPYPVLLRFNDENGNEVSWGGKFRVGSTITRIRNFSENNLLNGLYKVQNPKLNGNNLITPSHVVEKSMVFTCDSLYLLDNNEPKVILSPRLLRIPNSSYKILGHIPDISGHGNHGKINNSAYAGMSGANGYKQDFTSWRTNGSGYSIVTDSKYILTNEKAITNGGYFLWNRLAKDSFKVKISNIPNGGWMSYRYKITEEDTQFSSLFIREDGIYTLPATIADREVDFFISTVSAPAKDWIGLTIEQIGEYEGAYCLDGVDDFVTIPTLSKGGKQVLMKVNWQSIAGTAILYDQRTNGGFAIFNRDFDTNENKVPAYRARNIGGSTYIDGILNEYIYASQLKDTTHNIVELYDPELNIGTLSPRIGCSYLNSNYAQMSLYDFMLFDNISTDDKIKELNKYVGIEGNVWGILTQLSNSTLISNETLIKNE